MGVRRRAGLEGGQEAGRLLGEREIPLRALDGRRHAREVDLPGVGGRHGAIWARAAARFWVCIAMLLIRNSSLPSLPDA
ncbi:MAG: hypothetical protein A2X53_21065 [Candidatus Rokubacteria bacterium GWA2_70_23]|nr:MAG: hypothetical protein A2X53_21065 [Candidatus Rokubacteria bacterium GWA2_70_23]